MNKLDLAKLYKSYYTAKKQAAVVNIGPAVFLALPGKGDPSSPEFAEAIQALYSTAYKLKFNSKAKEKDFTVAKLEGQWWFDEKLYNISGPEEAPGKVPRHAWEYRLLIRLPEWVTGQDVALAKQQAFVKKGFSRITDILYFKMEEGKCIDILHTGPFDTEPESLALIHDMMQKNGFQRNGLHHEIYLSDFRKTSPEKLRTILRQPVK